MILRSAPASPFGRKVKMAAHIVGVIDRIKIVNADTLSAEDDLRQQNPLGKIPTLILDDGRVLYDSRVIVDYIDHLGGGGRVIPVKSPDRFDVLVMQALADGIMDAAILQIYELRFRAEDRRQNGFRIKPEKLSARSRRLKRIHPIYRRFRILVRWL